MQWRTQPNASSSECQCFVKFTVGINTQCLILSFSKSLFYLVQICDMVAIARHLNVTLIVPELDKTSFWADPRFAHLLLPHQGNRNKDNISIWWGKKDTGTIVTSLGIN